MLIDACAIRYGVGHLVRDLIKATGVRFYTTPMGRSAIDEDPNDGFGGVYVGGVTDPHVKELVEKTDLAFMVRDKSSALLRSGRPQNFSQTELICSRRRSAPSNPTSTLASSRIRSTRRMSSSCEKALLAPCPA